MQLLLPQQLQDQGSLHIKVVWSTHLTTQHSKINLQNTERNNKEICPRVNCLLLKNAGTWCTSSVACLTVTYLLWQSVRMLPSLCFLVSLRSCTMWPYILLAFFYFFITFNKVLSNWSWKNFLMLSWKFDANIIKKFFKRICCYFPYPGNFVTGYKRELNLDTGGEMWFNNINNTWTVGAFFTGLSLWSRDANSVSSKAGEMHKKGG